MKCKHYPKHAKGLCANCYKRNWCHENLEKSRAIGRASHQKRYWADPEKARARANSPKARAVARKNEQKLKIQILMHYGKNGKLQCCWPNCSITDTDMLTLDHINDDGAEHRRALGKRSLLYWIRNQGFPKIFQTLCHNHQWKKEMARRRKARK